MPESRVIADHRIMGGVPCVRGTRIGRLIVGLVAQGRTAQEILADYPTLTADDVRAALEFAAAAVSERQVPAHLGVKFLLDECLSQRVVSLLEEAGAMMSCTS